MACEAIHQQYTGVFTLLQGFDHIPSWSKIGSHLVVMAVVMDNMHSHVRLSCNRRVHPVDGTPNRRGKAPSPSLKVFVAHSSLR